MIRVSVVIALAALLLPSPALPFCFEEAGRAYGVSPQLLLGIARVESSLNPAAVNRNTNGSTDLGLMH
ncbi:MAG: transglycosylase SLT domain-containing protein [Deltaproteobacteria bacterium]|nr:transglycosylase SLT domain-containing protein [Deltaproteobacteria bacterium]